MGDTCAVLDWAKSGGMALTGCPDGFPLVSPASAFALLNQVTAQLARVTAEGGASVRADPAELIVGRAALTGFSRGGQISAGGSGFLLRAADGWCAVTLSRPDDIAAVPAIAGLLSLAETGPGEIATFTEAHRALEAMALSTPAEDLAAAAQQLGVPAGTLPAGHQLHPHSADGPQAAAVSWPQGRATRIAAPLPGAGLVGALVADLSSMWSGPLCARLLGLAGAEVVKVESPGRPDGARSGNREFYDWLHIGHRSLSVDFGTRAGHSVLAELLAAADVVIEASRPRALAALGLAPEMIPHRSGQVWLSITGYGRAAPSLVAFGDDAAVAGGLVGWAAAGSASEPVFCADAIADPLTGVCGALAVACSRLAGGGELIDLALRDVSAAFAAAAEAGPGHSPHDVLPNGSVACPLLHRAQAIRPPRRPASLASTHAAAQGADTSAVLAWLTGRPAAC